ncbi:rplX [Wigglesworthia glossinidia endosymbiont of Glossina brevipalpis]|uniref:Large ribosomal subunit protein uL24 n=1 Tax=Wigglesworthia glossinidia brevipalpis TaxID=36870 RepID=RL24_WIGBR|nr:RecName: Full=Large ribosomal subunit protein uL24; AltName: Full=50S ribosomal protein L24 [Wigglesworthia glossinidia endosymbiont of Glossina brevipalpis]BAC24700.1 rplX [Wigglesworthia glossinidia endosymbiont of Glossina brevipalpis]
MSKKIKLNDEIIVRVGKYKGKTGKIKKIFSDGKAIIEGINISKKHKKPTPNEKQSGGIFEKEQPISLSNVAIFNIDTNKPDKVKFKIEKGKKYRIFKSNGKKIK